MKNNKVLGLIGLSARARKVCFGADSVKEQIENRKVSLIIVAQDASERTKRNFKFYSEKHNIPIIIFGNIEEISKSIGKVNKAVIGIKDKNIAEGIQKNINGGEIIG